MLRAVMITYNDLPSIQRTIESIDFVDEIIAVDGRFIDFPGDDRVSTDGTLEYLRSLDKVRLILAPDMTEIGKRNKYLVGDKDDWYLHLDADEEWFGGRPELGDVDAYVCILHRERARNRIPRVRLFRHVRGLHYSQKHYWLRDHRDRTFALLTEVGKSYRGGKLPRWQGIYHNENTRSREREQAKARYYNTLGPRERKIKEWL